MTHDHLSRRGALRALTCCAAAPAAAALLPAAARAQEEAASPGVEPATPGLTPDEALALLRQGNDEFIHDMPYHGTNDRARRLEIAAGQHPFVVLVGCSDSRVSPEILFGRSLGELFIIRVAGNTVDLAALGSIEYAIAELGVPLVVVLGHERCGAVGAAVAVVQENATFPGRIGDMVEPIIPAVLTVRDAEGDLFDNAVTANVRRVVASLTASSNLLQERVDAGTLRIVGARYDLDDGAVAFLEDA